jgi:hypothetical protein
MSTDEPTKGEVRSFVESQLYDMEAHGYAHKDSLVDGIMELLKRQHDYDLSSIRKHLPEKENTRSLESPAWNYVKGKNDTIDELTKLLEEF